MDATEREKSIKRWTAMSNTERRFALDRITEVATNGHYPEVRISMQAAVDALNAICDTPYPPGQAR